MTVAEGTTSSTDAVPQLDDRSPADKAAFATASHVRIPTARSAAGSFSRAQLDAAIRADASENDRVIPTLPRPRTSPETPKPKVPGQRPGAARDHELLGLGIHYGEMAAAAAFGGDAA